MEKIESYYVYNRVGNRLYYFKKSVIFNNFSSVSLHYVNRELITYNIFSFYSFNQLIIKVLLKQKGFYIEPNGYSFEEIQN